MRLRAIALSALLITIAGSAFAQTVDLARDHVAITDLAGPWRFHPGDDPAWSSPSFDDSSWPLLFAGQSWTTQGYPSLAGVAWYRIRVLVPANPGPLAFFLPAVQQSAQVFANGRLIGHVGGLPPQPKWIIASNSLFSIPGDAVAPDQPLVLAIRVWYWPKAAGFGGGLNTIPRIGAASSLAAWRQLQIDRAFHNNVSDLIDCYVDLLTAFAGFGLFFLRRKERDYLWWGISQAFWAAFLALLTAINFTPMANVQFYAGWIVLFGLASWFQIEFYVAFLRQSHAWLYRGAVFFLLLSACLHAFQVASPSNQLNVLSLSAGAITQAFIAGMLWRGARARRFGALLLFLAYLPSLSTDILNVVIHFPSLAATPFAAWGQHFLNRALSWPVPVGAFSMTGDFEMLAVLVILILSYARSRRDEERLESELEAARTVQKVLIPDEVPSVPGFQLQTVYRPASQVGGDFFQIIPLPSGGALLTIGDVSGKGMPAAMTVSLLVGTFRTLAHYTQSPGEILRAMNQRMLARSGGGFTTCLVLRAHPDGTLTAASAGHPAPYLDGRELPVDNGLPLGLSADARYNEATLHLRPGEQLTLLTDGVPEARNADGALLGFERTAAISTQGAEDIARAAQHFGQQDDVTVIKLALAPAPVAA